MNSFSILLFILVIACSCSDNNSVLIKSMYGSEFISLRKEWVDAKPYFVLLYNESKEYYEGCPCVLIDGMDDYNFIIHWEGEKAIVFHPYSGFDDMNDGDFLETRQMKSTSFYHLFYLKEVDTYVRVNVSGYNFDIDY